MHFNSTMSVLACAATLLIGISAAQAEPSVCKGMEQASCTASGNCRWINSYKRSDGREVNGYCRKLPAKSAKGVSSNSGTQAAQPEKS